MQALLNARQEDGCTLWQHIQTGYEQNENETLKQYAMRILELEIEFPELPELGAHIWQYFDDLRSECGSEDVITSGMITNWRELTGTALRKWEIRALRRLARESRWDNESLRKSFVLE